MIQPADKLGHVCVVGAGIVGAATAYALSRAGWLVTIVDKESGPAQQTSQANGGQLSYSYVEPLATPYALKRIPFWLFSKNSPIKWAPQFSMRHFRWLLAFVLACNTRQVRRSTIDLLALSGLSREVLQQWLSETGVNVDDIGFRRSGKLVIFRDNQQLKAVQQQVAFQAKHGCIQRILDKQGCLLIEPALRHDEGAIAFGVYTESEEVVDCAKLTKLLLAASGAKTIFANEVVNFNIAQRKIQSLELKDGTILKAEQFVLSGGNGVNHLLEKLGKSLLIEPIKGYSIDFAIKDTSAVPSTCITDQGHKVVFAKIGNRLRVAGFAEIVGDTLEIPQDRIDSLAADTETLFPGAIDQNDALPWAGLRPASPTSLPYLGRIAYENLWINAGHGALGLTLAPGSAKVLAFMMMGKVPPINVDNFTCR
ncbi:D-amino acid dehydrogenase [Polynucleobacter sp. CS-Odin-A6]|uniref:D-amino acid dehydrogenase n=1 Tax=Polynucleobacter sp. CS-Odin-A6 TaxID=2689106 RepID=UPI001C0E2D49|nr:D-amino acid dehydrogenase [Polynucleobacter sp. CS-Odin-A6]MBU3621487.1 D-amino acid dehydrogenase [Polynucleobacter sp. CS-Odin-A6]